MMIKTANGWRRIGGEFTWAASNDRVPLEVKKPYEIPAFHDEKPWKLWTADLASICKGSWSGNTWTADPEPANQLTEFLASKPVFVE